MMLKYLLLLVLVLLILQELHGHQYYRHRRHYNRKKGVSSRRHSIRYRGVFSRRHSIRYRDSKVTQYGSYRHGNYMNTTPPPVGGGRSVRLPLNLYPIFYKLQLQPFIYGTNASEFYFTGKVTIKVKCRRSTNEIVLHSHQLNIRTRSVKIQPLAPGQNTIIPTIEFDAVNQFLILKSKTQLVRGSKYSVDIEFRGPLLSELAGFFQTSYQRGNDTIYIAQTHMQPTNARKTFPCFDEPAIKARFRVTLIRKKHFISLSNMNQIRCKNLANDWVADRYAVTPKISTYLLAFVVCDFVSKEIRTSTDVLYRVWARADAISQTTYALDVGARILTFYEEYFGYQFMLPKQDTIAVPDYLGSMENWGLIIQREEAMAYVPLETAEDFKEFVTMVISHELSHVWFGNLVTPIWWDELWLNEGFANYIAYVAINFIEPSWMALDQFAVKSVQRALEVDGLISSHPVYIPLSNPDEISQIFDTISYEKGGSILRMLQFILGNKTFQKGLQRYIRARAYGVLVHDDLWDALRKQSIKDGKPLDVKGIMDTWTLQMNYPTVFMERKGHGIRLSQSRYLLDKTATDPGTYTSPYGYKWEIPFTYATQKSKDFDQNEADIIWMGKDGADVLISKVKCGNGWFIGNIKQYGFYRVNYPEDNWVKLIDQLKTDHTKIHPVNRAQIIDDAWSLSKSGDLSMNIALQTLEYLSMEDSYFPFLAARSDIVFVRNMLERTEIYGDFSAFMNKIFSVPLSKLGYSNTGSGHLEISLRKLVLEEACRYGDQDCIDFAINSFQMLMNSAGNSNPIDVDLRSIVYHTAIQYGGVNEWEFAYRKYTTSNLGSDRVLFLYACSYSRDVMILNRFLQFILTDDIRKQDGENILRLISRNPIGRSLVWDFLRANWDDIINRFVSINFLIADVTAKFNTDNDLQSILTFKASRPNLGNAAAAIDRAIEKTRANIKWMDSNFQIIKDWLQNLP